jgi:hypothetical protein
VAVLLFLPHCFEGMSPKPTLGLPRLYSGDEPSYLIIINSLLNDGDLNVQNNYAAVHQGSNQAGRRFQQVKTLHHNTRIALAGSRPDWSDIYGFPANWQPDGNGNPVPVPVKESDRRAVPPDAPEYSIHQTAIAYLLAPLLYGFRGTDYLEPAAMCCSGLFTLAGMLFFRMLLRGLTEDESAINVATLVTFLATPVWFYGRALFMESFLLCFATGAYAITLRREKGLLPGVLLALGIQLKPYIILTALPLLALLAARKRWRECLALLLPLVASVAVLLVSYKVLYGGYFTPPQPFVRVEPWNGLYGQLFSVRFGLFLIAPAAVLALFCWPRLLQARPAAALVCAAGFAMQYVCTSCWAGWNGFVFGPRHLVPVLPLLFTSLAMCKGMVLFRHPLGRCAVAGVVAVSIANMLLTSVCYGAYWHRNPLIEICLYGNPHLIPDFLKAWYAVPF